MKKLLIVAGLVLGLMSGTGCQLLNPPKPGGDDGGNESGGNNNSSANNSGGGGGGGVDMRDYMQVADIFPIPDGMKEGDFAVVTTEIKAAGQKTTRKVSCVGKKGDLWKIEIDDSAQQGLIQGLLVNDKGKVQKAYAGKANSDDVKEIKILKTPEGKAGDEPPTETVKVKAGTFTCYKNEFEIPGQGKTTTWTGKDGDAEGIGVKSTGPGGNWELTKLEKKDKKVGNKTFNCRVATLSNGYETWYSKEPASFGGVTVHLKTDQMVMDVSDLGGGAKPQLKWPK